MLIVHSNYDAFGVGHNAPIETLYERLQKYTLDPKFEDYGDFCYKPYHFTRDDAGKVIDNLDRPIYPDHPEALCFFGNFFDVSGVFKIDTDEPIVIEKLKALIAANKSTANYANARKERQEPSWFCKALAP